MQSLLEALSGGEFPGTERLEEWETLLELAEEQHLLPRIAGLVREQEGRRREGVLPAAIESRLQGAERDALVAAFLQTAELKEILQAFAGSAIGVIPLKGPSLAQRVCGGLGQRLSRDLDVLVRKEDFQAASTLLRRLEYAPESLPDGYHQSWRRGASVVELHFDVEDPLAIDFEVGKVWQRARPRGFNGAPCWELAPQDELLLLCVHGVRHRFEYLGLVLDIALAVRAFAPEIGAVYPIDESGKDAAVILLLGLAMGRRLDPAVASLLSVAAGDTLSGHAERIAERLWDDLLSEEPTPLDWRRQHDFFLELEVSMWRRVRRRAMQLRILATRLIGPDVEFAAGYGLHRPWQARVLRPVRLALRGFQKAE